MNENIMNKLVKKTTSKFALGCGFIFFAFIGFVVVFYVVVKNMNTIQSLFDNVGNEYNEVEKVLNAFSLKAGGAEYEQLYKFLNELASKYNELEEETQRESDFDLPLIMATLHYEKLFDAKTYQDGVLSPLELTNRDVSNFLNTTIKTEYHYKMFYKWAYLMVGTPYSIPDINLRGLTGSLISAKVVSKCVAGGNTLSEKKLLESIVESEMNFTTGNIGGKGLWEWVLSLFGKEDDDDELVHNVYYDELEEKVLHAFNSRGTDDPITAFINFDQYDPDIKCGGGTTLEHQYIRTMNYDQYKLYLEKVFIPQNFLDCEECLYKDADEELRTRVTANMIRDIFDSAKTFYKYADLDPVNYEDLDTEGEQLPPTLIHNTTSPIVNTSCTVTSPYTDLRGAYAHHAIDSIVTGGNASDIVGTDVLGNQLTRDSLVSIADGIVKEVTVLTDQQFTYDPKAGTCTENMKLNGGIYVIIEHEVAGSKYESKYYHLKKDSVVVKEGETVKKGQKIAEIGTTGCSTGEHLHFEIYDVGAKTNLNPNSLFSKCENWESSGVIKIPTTDDYYADIMIEVVHDLSEEEIDNNEGKPAGLFPLEEYITGVVKAEMGGNSNDVLLNSEAYKAQAIAARTYAMKITNWGKNPIKNSSNNQNMAPVDIEGDDKLLYELVLETQGMVLTHTSDIFMSEYANWPCQKVRELYLSYTDRYNGYKLAWVSYVSGFAGKVEMQNPALNLSPEDFDAHPEWGEVDKDGHFTTNYWSRVNGIINRINEDLRKYYAKMSSCSWYYVDDQKIEDPYFLMLRTGKINPTKVGVDLKYLPLGDSRLELNREVFEVDKSYIKKQYYGHNRGMSQIGAFYLNSQGYSYVEILDEFYESEAGKTEILTAPALVTIFSDGEMRGKNQVEFKYGETLPGANNWHKCKAPADEDDFYAEELRNYMSRAGELAEADDVNPLRAKVVGAAYWLAYNPYFKVQYNYGGTYQIEGINNKWGCGSSANPEHMTVPAGATVGLDCTRFVKWAFAQIGAKIVLGTNDGPRRIALCNQSTGTGLTVRQIARVAQMGDVLLNYSKCHPGAIDGHAAIIYGVNPTEGTFSVIHASGYASNITITEYDDPGELTDYNYVFSMAYVYGEE